ncbi:hypothetical protein RRG08_002765 [Elysia crispata]|uniref:Calponin-homology (CH) domain-containing protein n=1 Tax=Elysia crispata TaxID=231223 RepID=A0AAE1CMD3_9GAST|nr:hypothetical protein RRG08_002765 [Elysia crispata]
MSSQTNRQVDEFPSTQTIDEREDIQKRTFTKWINSQLSKAKRATIKDLFTDLQDGQQLLALLEVLSGLRLKPEKGKLRVHHINNLNRALAVLENNYNVEPWSQRYPASGRLPYMWAGPQPQLYPTCGHDFGLSSTLHVGRTLVSALPYMWAGP